MRAGGAAGLLSIAMVLIGSGLAGCATKNLERQRPPYAGDAGMGWQLVMPSGPAIAMLDDNAPERSRRNAAFGTPPTTGVAAALYPRTDRPTITRTRRIFLDDRPDRPVFFLPERRQR